MGCTPECLLYGFSVTATAHKPQLYQDTTSEVTCICTFGDFLKIAIFFPSLCPGLLILFSWSGTNSPNFHLPNPRGFPICFTLKWREGSRNQQDSGRCTARKCACAGRRAPAVNPSIKSARKCHCLDMLLKREGKYILMQMYLNWSWCQTLPLNLL